MSLSSSNTEARVLSLEREAYRLYQQLVEMSTWRVRAIEEGLAMNWTGWRNRRCTTTFAGASPGLIHACNAAALPFGTIRFVGHQTGEDYGTFTAENDGSYVAELRISLEDTGLDIYIGGPGDRYSATPVETDYPFLRCQTINPDFQAVPGSDYVCVGGLSTVCGYPISRTLTLTDSFYGVTTTLTWDVPNSAWMACVSGIAYPGHGAAPACGAATTAFTYRVAWNGGASLPVVIVNYPSAFNQCPVAGNCASSALGQGSRNASFWNCPDPDTSTSFSATFSHPLTSVGPDTLYPGGCTNCITVTELLP